MDDAAEDIAPELIGAEAVNIASGGKKSVGKVLFVWIEGSEICAANTALTARMTKTISPISASGSLRSHHNLPTAPRPLTERPECAGR